MKKAEFAVKADPHDVIQTFACFEKVQQSLRINLLYPFLYMSYSEIQLDYCEEQMLYFTMSHQTHCVTLDPKYNKALVFRLEAKISSWLYHFTSIFQEFFSDFYQYFILKVYCKYSWYFCTSFFIFLASWLVFQPLLIVSNTAAGRFSKAITTNKRSLLT